MNIKPNQKHESAQKITGEKNKNKLNFFDHGMRILNCPEHSPDPFISQKKNSPKYPLWVL